jgi:hypothetical protein
LTANTLGVLRLPNSKLRAQFQDIAEFVPH